MPLFCRQRVWSSRNQESQAGAFVVAWRQTWTFLDYTKETFFIWVWILMLYTRAQCWIAPNVFIVPVHWPNGHMSLEFWTVAVGWANYAGLSLWHHADYVGYLAWSAPDNNIKASLCGRPRLEPRETTGELELHGELMASIYRLNLDWRSI